MDMIQGVGKSTGIDPGDMREIIRQGKAKKSESERK